MSDFLDSVNKAFDKGKNPFNIAIEDLMNKNRDNFRDKEKQKDNRDNNRDNIRE